MDSLRIECIQSGSKGNCYLLHYNDVMLMLDCGSALLKNKLLSMPIKRLKAVLITHKHGDHIKHLPLINWLPKCNLILNNEAHNEALLLTKNQLNFNTIIMEPNDVTELEQNGIKITIKAFNVIHDAKNNGYTVIFNNTKTNHILTLTYITDIGYISNSIRNNKEVINSNVLMFEANYDEELLKQNDINMSLKNRLTSGFGHISLQQSRKFINYVKTRNPGVKVCFVHASDKNTNEEIRARFLEHNEIWLQKGIEFKC